MHSLALSLARARVSVTKRCAPTKQPEALYRVRASNGPLKPAATFGETCCMCQWLTVQKTGLDSIGLSETIGLFCVIVPQLVFAK